MRWRNRQSGSAPERWRAWQCPAIRRSASASPSCFQTGALRIPGMALRTSFAQPRVQRIVDDESIPQLLVVVLEHPRQTQRYRQQSGALRFEIESFRIGASNNSRELGQRGISQFVLGEECIETAERAVVRQLDTCYVVWNGASFSRDALHIIRRHEQKIRVLVDETL